MDNKKTTEITTEATTEMQQAAQAFSLATMNEQSAAVTPAVTARIEVDGREMIADLTTATKSYCSLVVQDDADRVKVFNAVANAECRLSEHINEEIPVKHVFVEAIKCKDIKTGEENVCPRIVLIASDGRTFQAVSTGVLSSLKRLFQVFGEPMTWDYSVVIKAKRTRTRSGFETMVLEAVGVIPD